MNQLIRRALFFVYRNIVKSLRWTRFGHITYVERINNFVLARIHPPLADVGGHAFFLDEKDSLRLSCGDGQSFETSFLERQLRPGQVVVDVGANIGLFSLVFARAVGPQGCVYAFEPDPLNYGILAKNIERNGYQNVVQVSKAASNLSGTALLYRSKQSNSRHRLHAFGGGADSVNIEVCRLDEFFENESRPIALVKIDVEGAECAVLEGMERLFRKNPEIRLFVEFAPYLLQDAGSSASQLWDLLLASGFVIYQVDDTEQVVRQPTFDRISSDFSPENRRVTNFWCVRKADDEVVTESIPAQNSHVTKSCSGFDCRAGSNPKRVRSASECGSNARQT